MKKILLIIIFALSGVAIYGQLPDWTRNKPIPSNYSMDYEIGIGEGTTYQEAQNDAYIDVMRKLISRCRLSVSSEDIMKSVYEGKSLTMINKDFNLPPIREVCSRTIKLQNNKLRVYLLYQVPRDGSVISPEYEDFKDCDKISQFSNGKALAASFFIPGMGQMIKRRYTEGTFTLIGELALVGGGVGTYFIGKKQLDIIQNRAVEYEAFKSAQNTYNTMRIVSYTCYAAAAALYIFNLYRAYTVTPRIKRNFAFYPTLIPSNEYTQPTYALGAGMSIKF